MRRAPEAPRPCAGVTLHCCIDVSTEMHLARHRDKVKQRCSVHVAASRVCCQAPPRSLRIQALYRTACAREAATRTHTHPAHTIAQSRRPVQAHALQTKVPRHSSGTNWRLVRGSCRPGGFANLRFNVWRPKSEAAPSSSASVVVVAFAADSPCVEPMLFSVASCLSARLSSRRVVSVY